MQFQITCRSSQRKRFRRQQCTTGRFGMTVLEILVAATLALILILAMVQIFGVVGTNITRARATLEMSGQLRTASHRLRLDLEGVTCPVRPWISPADGLGYFEYIEGQRSDRDVDNDMVNDTFDSEGRRPGNPNDVFGSSAGDFDDVLMFTARSSGEPFVGTLRGTITPAVGGGFSVDPTTVDASGNPIFSTIESPIAEIIWWTGYVDRDGDATYDIGEPVTLHRRTLLIRPDISWMPSPMNVDNHYQNSDVSARFLTATTTLVANSLGDLTKRENRFAHTFGATTFPHSLDAAQLTPLVDQSPGTPVTLASLTGTRLGEDVILSSIVAFDVRIYDPLAPVRGHLGPDGALGLLGIDDDGVNGVDDPGERGLGDDVALDPGDPGYDPDPTPGPPPRFSAADLTTIGLETISTGAFVDLNYANETETTATAFTSSARLSQFSGLFSFSDTNGDGDRDAGELFLGLAVADIAQPAYCTWSLHYENDGIDQDDGGAGLVDEGTNGLDDDSTNGVDDPGERETSPPYPFPLRGIKVTLRVVETDTQQVRQTSVVVDFIPE